MELWISENKDRVILQLDQDESDHILGYCERDRAAILHDIYFVADDFFMHYALEELPIHVDIGLTYGVLVKQGTGRYDWKECR